MSLNGNNAHRYERSMVEQFSGVSICGKEILHEITKDLWKGAVLWNRSGPVFVVVSGIC